jgi:hypothetical protein
MKTVAGLFRTRSEAQQALETLRLAGFDPQRMSVIASPTSAGEMARDTEADVPASAAGGASLGAILGGATGWLVGIGTLAIPGIGPVVAAGPIAAALGVAGTTAAVGAGAGAVAGGLFGALSDRGFAEMEAREYEARVAQGDILLAVEVPDEAVRHTEELLRRAGADRFGSSGSVLR